MKHRLIQQIVQLTIICTMVLSGSAFALDPTYTGYFSSEAIKGYDTVAYFTEGKPVKGRDEYSTEHNQATWLFSSQQNLDLFLANPDMYAPQYGGYCAYAVATNTTASIKPELFTVVNDKLYLNYSKSINEKWLAQRDSYIVDADKNWPKLLTE